MWSGGTIDPALAALLVGGFTASVTDAAAPGSTPWSYTVNDANLDFLTAGETITLHLHGDGDRQRQRDRHRHGDASPSPAPTMRRRSAMRPTIGLHRGRGASAQDLSDSGTVSFDDIDTNDVVDISTR